MANPVLVEALRGDHVESRHRGSVAVVDADGGLVLSIGDIDMPVYPRSCVKAIQALPLVESGAADAYGFGERELALACSSHVGKAMHIDRARDMLAAAGLDEDALECGAHWPQSQTAMAALAHAGGTPSALSNNCSGKHAGFLCTCVHLAIAHHGYVDARHPQQEMVRQALEEVTTVPHTDANRGIDGCAIPTYAISLKAIASGFARMASGQGLSAGRARAARRLMAACMAEPMMVAGPGQVDSEMMQAGRGRVFAKAGAEGTLTAALPELGLGIAVKSDDGSGRAADCIAAAVLARFVGDAGLGAQLQTLGSPPLHNRRGHVVGRIRPTAAIAA